MSTLASSANERLAQSRRNTRERAAGIAPCGLPWRRSLDTAVGGADRRDWGGLATVAFHEGMAFTESVVTGHPGSLVAAAEALAPWRRWITPALGGIAAGAFL